VVRTDHLGPQVKPVVRVLVVENDEEDHALTLDLLARAVETCFVVEWATSVETGLRLLAESTFDVCLVDYRLPGRDGLCFVRLMQARGFSLPVVLVSGNADDAVEYEALETGVADYLDKEEYEVGRLERRLRFAVARERATQRLGHLAQHDELTGLANRSALRERLERALARSRRHRTHVAVLALDLDGFKPVNDRFGHAAGDFVLRAIGDRLIGRLRETDTVARIGGDEFAVVLENLQHHDDCALVARKILDTMAEPIPLTQHPGEEVVVGASIGVAVCPGDGTTGETLLRLADAAMYRAKKEGGRCCRFHDRHLDHKLARGALLERDLQDALNRNGLDLFYQPQVVLRSPVLGFSATPRWHHPELGLLDTDRFCRLAEDSGLLERLTVWMIEEAVARIAAWRDEGMPRLHVALPLLSHRQLPWSDVVAEAVRQLDAASLERDHLEFEVDETLLLAEMRAGGEVFEQWRESGLRFAATGFGASTGSLALLRDVPLRTLKLSRPLLRGTPQDKHRTLFADAVIQLGRHLGMRLVAEGADDAAQLSMLRRAGVDAVQAVISCPPLPANDCRAWILQTTGRAAQG